MPIGEGADVISHVRGRECGGNVNGGVKGSAGDSEAGGMCKEGDEDEPVAVITIQLFLGLVHDNCRIPFSKNNAN